jgi:hypothetical protein
MAFMFGRSDVVNEGALGATDSRKKRKQIESTDMKKNTFVGLIVAGFLIAGAGLSLNAQNCAGQGGNGKGYGCAAKTEQERAARQAACSEKNGGVCPTGGPKATCQGNGTGAGKGKAAAGNGARRGLRDGTGPRSANGTCPNPAPATTK